MQQFLSKNYGFTLSWSHYYFNSNRWNKVCPLTCVCDALDVVQYDVIHEDLVSVLHQVPGHVGAHVPKTDEPYGGAMPHRTSCEQSTVKIPKVIMPIKLKLCV